VFVGSSSKSGAILYSENLAGLRIQIDGIKVEKVRNKQSSTLFELSYGALELKNSNLTDFTGNLFKFTEMAILLEKIKVSNILCGANAGCLLFGNVNQVSIQNSIIQKISGKNQIFSIANSKSLKIQDSVLETNFPNAAFIFFNVEKPNILIFLHLEPFL